MLSLHQHIILFLYSKCYPIIYRKWKHPDQYIIVFANKEDMQVSVNDHMNNTKHKERGQYHCAPGRGPVHSIVRSQVRQQ